jgi:uncharacterized LabA/DUF88 family protein
MISNTGLPVPFKDTIEVIQSGPRRIKLFVDFWNVVINARSQCKKYDVHVHWDKLVDHLVAQTRQGYHDKTTGELAGCYIFGSRSQSNPQESNFVKQTLDLYGSKSGLFFTFAERVPKQTATMCSKCGEQVRMNSESGIDVMLAVEMIKHAGMREHEYLALVSSDRDFIPLLSFLGDQGQRVLHVAAGAPDREMRSITWEQVNLQELYPYLCTIEHEGYIVLTAPSYEKELKQVLDAAPIAPDQIEIIDIADKSQLNDKDLDFLLSSFGLYWHTNDRTGRQSSHRQIVGDLDELRRQVGTGDLHGSLPCVVRNGVTEVCFTRGRWVQTVGHDFETPWSKLFANKQSTVAGKLEE